MKEKGERARVLRGGRKGVGRILIQTESVYTSRWLNTLNMTDTQHLVTKNCATGVLRSEFSSWIYSIENNWSEATNSFDSNSQQEQDQQILRFRRFYMNAIKDYRRSQYHRSTSLHNYVVKLFSATFLEHKKLYFGIK